MGTQKEYRIVYPLDENSKGMNVPIHKLGMITSQIVSSINCSEYSPIIKERLTRFGLVSMLDYYTKGGIQRKEKCLLFLSIRSLDNNGHLFMRIL